MGTKTIIVIIVLVIILIVGLVYGVLVLENNNELEKDKKTKENREKLRELLRKVRGFKETCSADLKLICSELEKEILNGISSNIPVENVINRCRICLENSFERSINKRESYTRKYRELLNIFI